ncbi:hypothetical protein BpHYR1_049608 [Brachionus plicatilis]|uniref:Uncharacterized protein n=1 Tax=Brachionus plicatilis TaxID=10195 RepID=A0A3M7P1F3_BRAPC|nr:hypothetical protein BpHYR1_049608 [Brachionus plicatilis]
MNATLVNRTNESIADANNVTWATIVANSTAQFGSKISSKPVVFLPNNARTTTLNLLTRLRLTNSSESFNQSTSNASGFRHNLKQLCNCERSLPFSNKIYAQNENIWKLAFFALAFIVGLVSMMLILTFSTKILLNRFNKKSDYKQKKISASKKSRKVSSISLLDFDAELASNYAVTLPSRKKQKRSFSSPSSASSARINLKSENSSDSTIYSSQNLLNSYIKNPLAPPHSNRQQSYIYGITNKAFEDDMDKTAKCEKIASFRSQNVPSSFKPFTENKKINTAKSCQTENADKNEKINEHETYMQPWKLPGLVDEYEALEINPIIESEALSPATTFSECLSERQNDLNYPAFSNPSNKIRDFNLMCMNNNELISKSTKITQELEKKLKERRLMMESKSDKFNQKISEKNDKEISPTVSLSALEKRIQSWQNELNTKLSKKNSVSSNSGCVCPCHSHSCNARNSFRNCAGRLNFEKDGKDILHKTSAQNRQIIKAKDKEKFEPNVKSKKAKIVIDNASALPTKRESIRALMETRTVTQNKQKEVLEMHLNTLISSRRASCNIAD